MSWAQATIELRLLGVTTAHGRETAANKMQAAFCNMAEILCSVVDRAFTENVFVLMLFIDHLHLLS